MKSTTLHVGNLPVTMTEGDLRRIFTGAGKVQRVTIARDPENKSDYALIEMASENDATMAIDYLDGKEFDGNALTVAFAALARGREKEEALFQMKSAQEPLNPPSAQR